MFKAQDDLRKPQKKVWSSNKKFPQKHVTTKFEGGGMRP